MNARLADSVATTLRGVGQESHDVWIGRTKRLYGEGWPNVKLSRGRLWLWPQGPRETGLVIECVVDPG